MGAYIPGWTGGHLVQITAGVAVAGGLALLLAYLCRGMFRRPAAVIVAAIAAAGCTAYSADTSWRFAADHLSMTSAVERGVFFAAGELALFSMALMARQNLNTTGAPGVPGALVWVITGVQIIPAYAESGIVGGTVRAFVGPILAALLWHLAMGIELRHTKPGANSQSLPSIIGRELRERFLSRLGLATRNRSAEQITRDRWTRRAVEVASALAVEEGGSRRHARLARRLAKAVDRAQVGQYPEQRETLLLLLAARRNASELARIGLPSPWRPEPEPGTGTEPLGGTNAPSVPARVVLVPVPGRAVPRPELQAVPELNAEAEPQEASEPARPRNRRTVRKSAKDAAFHKHVRSARRWLAGDPELSGTDIGKKLGTSDRYGRKVKRAALETAS